MVRGVSERLASELDAKVVVAAGLHWDHLTSAGVAQAFGNVNALVDNIIREMRSTDKLVKS